LSPSPEGEGDENAQNHFALLAASFLHAERNFLRSLPLSPLASASLEHSIEAALRGLSAFFAAGAVVAAGVSVLSAGAGVCANAALIRSREAKAVATAREDIGIMAAPRVEEARNLARRC
jgi:hypothetical protein